MEKFEKLILKLAETDHPNRPLTPSEKTLVQDRLNQLSSQYQTPDHPPYSAMIERAIRELNEKRGSTENSISQFLEKEYNRLPWAHSILLKHHLQELCESEDIVLTRTNKYILVGGLNDPTPNFTITKCRKRKSKPRKRHGNNKRKNRKRTNREYNIQEIEEIENGVFCHEASSSTPELPPGYESIIDVEELCESKRRERQLRRWSMT